MTYGHEPIPATEKVLCQYLAFRFETSNVQGDSVKNELYGIRSTHIDLGHSLEITDKCMPRLARVRRGFKKLRCSNICKKPITDEVLEKLLSHLRGNRLDILVWRALLVFAKFGLLRVSEYVGFGDKIPVVEQVRFVPDFLEPMYLVYIFDRSKTNQFKKTEKVITVCNCPKICPVHAMQKMLLGRQNLAGSNYLFQFENGTVPHAKTVNFMIGCLCERSGLDKNCFSSHCLRKGGALDFITRGVPPNIVLELGRWKSMDSMKPYLRGTENSMVAILNKYN